MRIPRIVFLSALALVTGCGGCDSCFGAKEPGDDDASAVTTARPQTVVAPPDAEPPPAPVETGDDAGKPAAPTASEIPRNVVPPRPPKAPMPLGATQSCGVYEGPHCERECKNGNCRQDCDGVECTLKCDDGYCSQFCGPDGKCRMTCNGGHCIQVCSRPTDCLKECAGGNCQ